VNMMWFGGTISHDKKQNAGKAFNPFMVADEDAALYFTEKFPTEHQSLQWSLELTKNFDDIDPSHGNRPYASQDLKQQPAWTMSKECYLDFTSMRQFPHVALRKLCVALKHGSLPLQRPAVHMLIRQTLYHVGDLKMNGNKCVCEWRRDFVDIRKTCEHLIKTLAVIHAQKPHYYKACIILGEMSCYFSTYTHGTTPTMGASFTNVAKGLASASIEWANSYDDMIPEASPEHVSSLRSKQSIFLRTAVLCLVHGNIDTSDAQTILTCMARARNVPILDNDGDSAEERSEMENLCEYYLSRCWASFGKEIAGNLQMISHAVRAVVRTAPSDLEWNVEKSQVAFTARGDDGHWYSMNTLTGVVLVDGLPLNKLTLPIVSDPGYKKIFGSTNFEVILKNGIFETVHPVDGFFYRFQKTNIKLCVQESARTNTTTKSDHDGYGDIWNEPLELLDMETIGTWGADLPKQLKEAFSHWVSRKHSVVIFRSFDFRQRTPCYIHHIDKCVRVHRHINDSEDSWLSITQKSFAMDSLVVHELPLLKVLERFDSQDMMHSYITNEDDNKGLLIIELYRFGLSFKCEVGSKCCKIECCEIVGYHLKSTQHLSGRLHGLCQYLVLESVEMNTTKVIVPFGTITADKTNGANINLLQTSEAGIKPTENKVSEQMRYFIYDLHPRFGYLFTNSINARLYLAGLYVATTSFVPDYATGMTGEERAIELLRSSWQNRPLSNEEKHCLENVKELCHNKYPCLSIICHDIQRSSEEYHFLHTSCVDVNLSGIGRPVLSSLSNEASVYKHMAEQPLSPRMCLNHIESCRLLGSSASTKTKTTLGVVRQLQEIDICPIGRDDVTSIYGSMRTMWLTQIKFDSKRDFPLCTNVQATSLERGIFEELEKSWKLHCEESGSRTKLVGDIISTSSALVDIREKVKTSLNTVEGYLFKVLNPESFSGGQSEHVPSMQLFRLANIISSLTRQDLARLACNPAMISHFNPLLAEHLHSKVRESIILWLELSVLEDKCDFLLSFTGSLIDTDKVFLRELVSERNWDVYEHPYWLVFEVEQRIRIRPEQFEVANRLIENSGEVVQLNMGLGKTRVILPMLILYWSSEDNIRRIPRLCIPSTLLSEVYDYFHSVMSASVSLGRRLFVCPFRRDVELDEKKVQLLLHMKRNCEQNRGFLVVAPEHRLSMKLKVKELVMGGDRHLSEKLNEFVKGPWHDVFDEVDEILHHRYSLVYSVGNYQSLPQGEHRWKTIQAVLRIITELESPGVVLKRDVSQSEAFPRLIIDDDINISNFRSDVATSLLEHPPFELSWMKSHGKGTAITRIISIQELDPGNLRGSLSEEHFNDVLALRGLLAYDLLLHCLRKRHRVDYGVDKSRKKKLSVPFRGADTPSQRSEFSHPDCALLLTILAYYDQGLEESQLKEVFEELLRRGRNSKNSIYNEWLEYSKERMSNATYESISCVDKIDLSNASQMEVLYANYRKNPATINHWLNTFVFPTDMCQYSKRLVANPWHLAENTDRKVVGFSGTNDNHLILPLQVKQHLPWSTTNSLWRELLGTNGKMLDVVTNRTLSCKMLQGGRAKETLLNFIKSDPGQYSALIDCGALLAGLSNLDVARILTEGYFQEETDLKGVTFFDESRMAWMVMEKTGRCLPKNQSPFKSKQTFALFDEPRCRGVDLKLDVNAVAVMTVGPMMCKDKFMQAAGRMRQLDHGQQLVVVGEKKVFDSIRHHSKLHDSSQPTTLKIEHVLSWVMHNTVESIWKGLSTWSDQGIFYATGRKPEDSVLDERVDLDLLYGSPIVDVPLIQAVRSTKESHCKRTGCSESSHIKDIVDRCDELGSGYSITRTGIDEECERELQREIEVEQEEEVAPPRVLPLKEADWDYSSIFNSVSIRSLPITTVAIVDVVGTLLSGENLSNIGWSESVFCTQNFTKTVNVNGGMDDFLRIPDAFVRFPSDEILLLSNREADQILLHFLDRKENKVPSNGYYFDHCAFATDKNVQDLLRHDASGTKCPGISDEMSCSVKLFNGETIYRDDGQRRALKSMLSCAKKCALSSNKMSVSNLSGQPDSLVIARMKLNDYDRSDLQAVVSQIASEFEAELHD